MFYKLRTSEVVHTTLKVWPEFEKRNESIMAIYSYLIGSIYQIGRVGIESKFGSRQLVKHFIPILHNSLKQQMLS